MRRSVFLVTIFLFAMACQQPLVLEYKKYDNDLAVPRISVEEAKKDFDAGHVVFVDSRGKGAFDVEHLPGAIAIAYNDPESEYDKLPKGKKIVIYCS